MKVGFFLSVMPAKNQKPIGFLESALNENIITVLGIEIINGYQDGKKFEGNK